MALDLNELRSEQTRLESQGQSSFFDNFVKMPDGEGIVTVRILPPKKSQKLYCVTRTHKLGQKNFHCPRTLINGKWQGLCPICNHYQNLWKESDKRGGDEAKQLITEARAIKPLERYYYNVIVRSQINPTTGAAETNVGPKILSIGKQLHARIIRAIVGDPALEEPELGDVTDPVSGRDLKIIKRIRKSGMDSFPNYDESKFMQPSVLGTDKEVAMWLENLHDLQALRMVRTTEELMKELRIFQGLESDTDSEFGYGANTAKKEEPTVTITKNDDNDEAMVEDDFLAELRRL